MIDLTPIVDGAAAVALAVITACVPIITTCVLKKLGFDKDTALRDSLNTALTNSVGAALRMGAATGDAHLANVSIKSVALEHAAAYVMAAAPDAVAHFNLTPAAIATKAANFLQQHLANAPAPAAADVTAVVPVPTTAPVTVADPAPVASAPVIAPAAVPVAIASIPTTTPEITP